MATTTVPGAILVLWLAIALAWSPLSVSAEDSAAQREELHRDIHVAITLAGYHCTAISVVVQDGLSEYSVGCRNGTRFRVYSIADERVHVVDRTPGVVATPAGREDHDTLIARSLFAIVNLSGYNCDRVVRMEREPRLHYRVWCGNDTQYRLSLTADERVAVERLR